MDQHGADPIEGGTRPVDPSHDSSPPPPQRLRFVVKTLLCHGPDLDTAALKFFPTRVNSSVSAWFVLFLQHEFIEEGSTGNKILCGHSTSLGLGGGGRSKCPLGLGPKTPILCSSFCVVDPPLPGWN